MASKLFYPPPDDVVIEIPRDLLEKFETVPRIVVRWPWIVGIPAPDWLIRNPELLGRAAQEFDVMLIPKQGMR